MPSAADLLTDLLKRFDPSAAAGLSAVYQLTLTGDGAGTFHLKVANQECQLTGGPAEKPDVAITVSAEDWAELVAGRLDPLSAFFTGRLRIDGDLTLATRLQALFAF